MRTAAFLVIGNELLSGKIQEANTVELARLLRRLGVRLVQVSVVLDDVDTIAAEVRRMSRAHELVFTSGGVGPTHDDVTMEGVAKAFGVPVVCDEVLAAMLREHYGDRLTEGHLRMALVPEGARREATAEVRWPLTVIENVHVLPGIPEVFRFKLKVVEALVGHGDAILSRAVYTQMDEGHLKPLLDAIVAAYPEVDVGSYPAWSDPTHKTKLTFDATDAARIDAAVSAFVASLPEGEPAGLDPPVT